MRDPVELLRRLAAAPADFDFYAALRLIECAHPELPRVGQARRPQDEALRFGQQPSLAFEPAMLAALQHGAAARAGGASDGGLGDGLADGGGAAADGAGAGPAPRLLVNFFGLLGANGPLPTHLTEYIRDRLRNVNDPTLTAFLDVFNHRMISLFYRAWSSAQPAVSLDRPGADRFTDYIASLIGLGMPSLRQRDAVPDFAKLHYAGRMAQQARNGAGLEAVLADFFKVPVRVEQFVGHWMTLPADGLCGLRSGPHAEVLGLTTVIGKKVWNAQHKFRLVIGPLDIERARQLLPGGAAMGQLAAWVDNYAGLTLDWDVRLIIKKEQVPALRLGAAAKLGWTSWVSSATPQRDDDQLCFHPRRGAGAPAAEGHGGIHQTGAGASAARSTNPYQGAAHG